MDEVPVGTTAARSPRARPGPGARRHRAAGEEAWRVRVEVGPGALDSLGPGLDDLHAATGAPVTARRRWLQAWVDCYAGWEPFVVGVGRGEGLDGAAPLAWRRTAGVTTIVAIGDGPADHLRLPARTADAADVLAEAVAATVAGLPGPWRLVVRRLPVDDPVAAGVARHGGGRCVEGPMSFTTRFGADRRVRAYLSRNEHRELRRMRNRLAREGRAVEVAAVRDPDRVAAVLPEVELVQRARDTVLGRASKLDDPRAGPFYRRVLLDHAAAGELELVTLRLDGALVSYVVLFLDGGSRRAWNTAFLPEAAEFGPGRLVLCAALEAAVDDPDCAEFDWMLGDEAYKRSFAIEGVASADLLTWSSPGARAALDAPRRAKAALRPLKRRYGPLDRGWERAKHGTRKLRHGA